MLVLSRVGENGLYSPDPLLPQLMVLPHNPAVDRSWHPHIHSRSMELALGLKMWGKVHSSRLLEYRGAVPSGTGLLQTGSEGISLFITPFDNNFK